MKYTEELEFKTESFTRVLQSAELITRVANKLNISFEEALKQDICKRLVKEVAKANYKGLNETIEMIKKINELRVK